MTHALSSIDPRIRARRIQVRRAEGRRRLRVVAWGIGVVAVVLAAYGLTRTPLLDVDHVAVEGTSGSHASEVLDAIGPITGTALLDIDTGPITDRIEALPWVAEAQVERAWPGTIEIGVTPRVAVAVIPAPEGSVATVDATSTVIEIGAAPAADSALPFLEVDLDAAPGEMQLSATPALAVVAALPDDLRPWVDGVRGDPTQGVGLVLDLVGSAEAEIGDTALLPDKLEALRAVLAGAELDCVSVIDVSVADLSTVTRDPACDGGSAAADG